MQDTNNIEITSGYFTKSSDISTFLISFLNVSKFKNIYSDVRSIYSRSDVIRLLVFSKYFENKSVRSLVTSDISSVLNCGKDVFYTIKNCININWRKVMWNHAMECISKMADVDMNTKVSHLTPCLIVDDSDVPKRGKYFEMIGKIFSHTGHNYKMGFKSLNLCYWTGKTTINLDFSLHIEKRKDGKQGLTKKEIEQRYSKERLFDSYGSKRLSESMNKKTQSLVQMIKRAAKKGVKAKYLLVDSWFFNQELVKFITQTKLELITRPKKNNWRYEHKDKSYTIGKLLNKYKNHKERKWSRKLKMHYIRIKVKFQGQQMSLYFYKPKKRGSKWQILISTKKNLDAIKAYEIYKNRWAIEVTYKELKQHFKYGKCQSRDFIGQISDHSICLMAYNFLSTYKCVNEHESIGMLFEQIKQDWIRPTIMEKFWQTILKIAETISQIFNIELDDVMEKAINDVAFFNYFNLNQLILTTET